MKFLDRYEEQNLIFFDIETARSVENLEEGTPLWDAWAYKSRYENELNRKTGLPMTPQEYFIDKAALYGPFGRVVAVVAGRISGDVLKTKKYFGKDEQAILQNFNNDLGVLTANPAMVLAGWANIGFDQPFLWKRMIVNGVNPNHLLDNAGEKPWTVPAIDLKDLWKNTGFYPDSLIATAVALGLPSPKNNMDGSQVSNAFYEGKYQQIADYCEQDVLTTANIYRKFVNKPLVTLK